MQQGIMGSHASPDLWISAEKIQDQQNSGAHFVMLEFRQKKFFFSRNPRENHWISRSPLHKTRRWVPPRHGSEYKAPRTSFFSAEVRYTICVVEFRWKTKKLKSAKKHAIDSGAQDLNFPPIFFSADLMPHNRPQRKKGPQSPQRFVWQTNLRLQCKVLSPRPYPTIGHGWHMWSGGTCLGNPWKIVWTWWWAI